MNHNLSRGFLPAAAAVLLTPWLAASTAAADTGVGIQAAAITLNRPALAGQTTPLPAAYIVNTGTSTTTVHASIKQLPDGKAGRVVPVSWILIARNDFGLKAKTPTTIALRVRVPRTAAPGAYRSDFLVSVGSSNHAPGGASLGAAAATELRFTVAVPTGRQWRPSNAALITLAAAAALAALAALVRRTGIRLRLERRS
jgi:hypothetical protein